MEHYWGAKAILERIGLKNAKRLPFLIKKYHLPAYRRRLPGKARIPYYSNSEMILRWELSKAQLVREALLSKEEELREKKKYAYSK